MSSVKKTSLPRGSDFFKQRTFPLPKRRHLAAYAPAFLERRLQRKILSICFEWTSVLRKINARKSTLLVRNGVRPELQSGSCELVTIFILARVIPRLESVECFYWQKLLKAWFERSINNKYRSLGRGPADYDKMEQTSERTPVVFGFDASDVCPCVLTPCLV